MAEIHFNTVIDRRGPKMLGPEALALIRYRCNLQRVDDKTGFRADCDGVSVIGAPFESESDAARFDLTMVAQTNTGRVVDLSGLCVVLTSDDTIRIGRHYGAGISFEGLHRGERYQLETGTVINIDTAVAVKTANVPPRLAGLDVNTAAALTDHIRTRSAPNRLVGLDGLNQVPEGHVWLAEDQSLNALLIRVAGKLAVRLACLDSSRIGSHLLIRLLGRDSGKIFATTRGVLTGRLVQDTWPIDMPAVLPEDCYLMISLLAE